MKHFKSLFLWGQALKKEYIGIGFTLFVFFIFPQLIRSVDATAAPIDAGALSAILMAVLAIFIFKLSTWWLINIIWPVFASYAHHHFENHFKSLLPWQKIIVFLAFYCFLLSAFIFTLMAIL